MTTLAGASEPRGRKRSRYLRDTDRRNIIQRIENGEKQAALAREFGVTRAAICHINKNRDEILTRYEMLVKSANDMDDNDDRAFPMDEPLMVHQLRSHAMIVMLTRMRDVSSTTMDYRNAADRAMTFLLEEAMLKGGTTSIEVATMTGSTTVGRQRNRSCTAIAVGESGMPLLSQFRRLEPKESTGFIYLSGHEYGKGKDQLYIERMDLPPGLSETSDVNMLLLVGTCTSGANVNKVIQALRSLRIQETRICIVCIAIASDAIATVCSQYPQARFVVGAIDELDGQTGRLTPGIGDFLSRYSEVEEKRW